VIARSVATGFDWYAGRRRRRLEALWRRPAEVQEAALRSLLKSAGDTEFGLAHAFRSIRTVAQYQERVPVREYADFEPLWERAVAGARGVTWPGFCRDWVKTSGTTGGSKVIPVTTEAFASHRKGGWDALLLACSRVGARQLFGRPMLSLGGSTELKAVGSGCRLGDLSGLTMRRLPPGIRGRYSLGPEIGGIADWERPLDAIAELVAAQDLRLISGMPSWMVVLFERVGRRGQAEGRPMRDLAECWPGLRVLIHGGVAFAPYAAVFHEWMGRRLDRIEVYPACEGFVAVQTEASGSLTLMLDYGIFYEFVPVEDVGSATPRRHTVAHIQLHRPYAVVMSTPGGLWSYLLGDTVRFVARDPLRLVITGRTRHYVNAFGENVIVEEVERALTGACRRTEAEVVEFTVAPRFPSSGEPRGGHEWLVEFRLPPREPEDFVRVLDETLIALNTDYRTKRSGPVGMLAPRVTALPPGTFSRWMREKDGLGDQHKVPRVTNDRRMAEGLFAVIQGAARPLANTLTT